MINIRKLVLLSILLVSVSSVVAPTYAMITDEPAGKYARAVLPNTPMNLTEEILANVLENKSFLTSEKRYALEKGTTNQDLLDFSYFLNPDFDDLGDYIQMRREEKRDEDLYVVYTFYKGGNVSHVFLHDRKDSKKTLCIRSDRESEYLKRHSLNLNDFVREFVPYGLDVDCFEEAASLAFKVSSSLPL